jgi:hypothetical protein
MYLEETVVENRHPGGAAFEKGLHLTDLAFLLNLN